MATLRAPNRVIWSMDAFEEDSASATQVIDMLRLLSRGGMASIEPVYVLSPEQLDLQLAFSPPWVEHYRPAAQRAMEQKAQALGDAPLLPPMVLLNRGASTRASTRTLAKYARTVEAEMIVVGSHARRGMARYFVGSFAESLLLQSKIPVMVVNPSAKIRGSLRKILFPTDFETHSFETFKGLLEFARIFGAQVVVHHAMKDPITPVFQSGVYLLGGGWVPVRTFLEHEEVTRKKQAELWMRTVRKMRVDVDFRFDREATGTADSVIRVSEEIGADLIAMAAHSGPVSTALLGSVTRQVLRASKVPVWVIPARG